MIVIIIAEGIVICYQLHSLESKKYAERENELIRNEVDALVRKLDLERKGLRNDSRGGDFCPACESKAVAKIHYGYYDSRMDYLKKEIESKKVIIGGCMVCEDSKKYYCNNCGYMWGRLK